MARLPKAEWTQREDLARLVSVLGAENVRWVGGAVRDTLLGTTVRDVDAATTLLPDTVMEKLKAAGIKPVPTGIDHGTVTAVLPAGNVEITTLRKDVATNGRRATVAFATDWRDDAARRDFTINALYAEPGSGVVHDYFGGIADLRAGVVRFIGDARERIREDHLRILRYYRFQTRFGSALDSEAEEACADLAPTMKGLSRERIAMELLNLLALPAPADTVARMEDRGVLGVILPEAAAKEVAALARLVDAEKSSGIAPHPLRRLAALIPPSPEVARDVAARLRLSRAQKLRLVTAASREAADSDGAHALAYRHGLDSARDRLLLGGANTAMLDEWNVPQFPVKGRDVIERGVSAGPQVAAILQDAEERWIAAGFPDREAALAHIDAAIAAAA